MLLTVRLDLTMDAPLKDGDALNGQARPTMDTLLKGGDTSNGQARPTMALS